MLNIPVLWTMLSKAASCPFRWTVYRSACRRAVEHQTACDMGGRASETSWSRGAIIAEIRNIERRSHSYQISSFSIPDSVRGPDTGTLSL